MPGKRYPLKSPQDNNVFDFDAGFAAPDPSLEDWEAPADCVPVSADGRHKDFRLAGYPSSSSTKRTNMKSYGRSNASSSAASRATGPSSSEARSGKKKYHGASQDFSSNLNGSGSWAEFMQGVQAVSAPKENVNNSKIEGSSRIKEMNEALKRLTAPPPQNRVYPPAGTSATQQPEKPSPAQPMQQAGPKTSRKVAIPPQLRVPPHLRGKSKESCYSPSHLNGEVLSLNPGLTSASSSGQALGTQSPTVAAEPTSKQFAFEQSTLNQSTLEFPPSSGAFTDTFGGPNRGVVSDEFDRFTHGLDVDRNQRNKSHLLAGLTLSNGPNHTIEIEKKPLAQLHMKEFGVQDISTNRNFLKQHIEDFEIKQDRSTAEKQSVLAVQALGLYDRCHKVNELDWKQSVAQLPHLQKSREELFSMPDVDFQAHYAQVSSICLAQWKVRADRIVRISTAQSKTMKSKSCYLPDELMEMSDELFDIIYKHVCFRSSVSQEPSNKTDTNFTSMSDGRGHINGESGEDREAFEEGNASEHGVNVKNPDDSFGDEIIFNGRWRT